MTSHTAQPVNPALFRSRARLRATFSNAGTAIRRTPLWWLAGLLPGAYALATGLHRFSQVHGARLDPDAITYLRLAAHMTPATVLTGQKEPLWPALSAIPVSVVGAHPGVIRLLGVAGFLLLVVAFQRLVALLYGRAWGIMAALLFAAAPAHHAEADIRRAALLRQQPGGRVLPQPGVPGPARLPDGGTG
jgi:hypothetical protein